MLPSARRLSWPTARVFGLGRRPSEVSGWAFRADNDDEAKNEGMPPEERAALRRPDTTTKDAAEHSPIATKPRVHSNLRQRALRLKTNRSLSELGTGIIIVVRPPLVSAWRHSSNKAARHPRDMLAVGPTLSRGPPASTRSRLKSANSTSCLWGDCCCCCC